MLQDKIESEFIFALKKLSEAQDLSASEEELSRLATHYALMLKWNKTTNLTRITSLEESVCGHYLDCLVGLKAVPPGTLTDAGSGAGFPGLVAAIVRPKDRILLVEAAQKRCTFLELCVKQLKLKNCSVKKARVENLSGLTRVISRATFSLQTMEKLLAVVSPGGEIYLWINSSQRAETINICRQLAGDLLQSTCYSLPNQPKREILAFRKRG